MGSTKPEKKEKKEKSSKRAEVDGVSKVKSKDGKKDKKDKKDKLKSAVINASLDEDLQADAAASVEKAPEVTEVEVEDEDGEKVTKAVVGALVPFARPLADEKGTKKILRSVKKGKPDSLS